MSRLSLWNQLLLAAGLVTLLLAAGLLLVLPTQFDRLGQRAYEQEAEALATLVAQASGPSVMTAIALGDPSAAGEQLTVLSATPQVEVAAIYGPEGALLASFATSPDDAAPAAMAQHDTPNGVAWTDTALTAWHEMRDGAGALHGTVELRLSRNRLKLAREENLQTAVLLTVSLALVLLLMIVFLGSRLTHPIQKLTTVAEDVAAGRSTPAGSTTPTGGDSANELARLTHAFFTMLERLHHSQQALESQVVEVDLQRAQAEQQRAQAEAERVRAEGVLADLQQTQEQLVRSEKMASLGQLIAGIAHELNTPMGAVNASAEILQEHLGVTLTSLVSLLRDTEREAFESAMSLVVSAQGRPRLGGREGRQARRSLRARLEAEGIPSAARLADTMLEVGFRPDDSTWASALERPDIVRMMAFAEQLSPLLRNADNVRVAAQKAKRIVTALKTFSHQGASGERAPVDVTTSIQTVLTLYENQLKRGVTLDVQLTPDLELNADADALSQVWTNLIQNAIQAMRGRGRMWIIAEPLPDARIRVVIGNDGPSIPEDIRVRIFEAFFTTKAAGEGSGLGLDIVRRIVTDHGGTIDVRSTEASTEFETVFTLKPTAS